MPRGSDLGNPETPGPSPSAKHTVQQSQLLFKTRHDQLGLSSEHLLTSPACLTSLAVTLSLLAPPVLPVMSLPLPLLSASTHLLLMLLTTSTRLSPQTTFALLVICQVTNMTLCKTSRSALQCLPHHLVSHSPLHINPLVDSPYRWSRSRK